MKMPKATAMATHTAVIFIAFFALMCFEPLLNIPRSKAISTAMRARNPIQNQILSVILFSYNQSVIKQTREEDRCGSIDRCSRIGSVSVTHQQEYCGRDCDADKEHYECS
jgi:hypothetical protein